MKKVLMAFFAFAAMASTFMGLGNLIQPGSWQEHLILLPLMVTVAMWAVVAVIPDRFPRLAGLGSLLAGLLVWVCYMCGTAGDGRGIWPTPSALDSVRANLQAAVMALPDYGRPAANPELFLPLGLVGLGPMCVLGVFLALGARRPAWLGLPALACWVVFLSGDPSHATGWILAAGVAYLLLLAVAPRKGRVPRRFRLMAIPVAALAAVAALVVSMAAPSVPGWGRSMEWLTFWNSNYSDGTGINVNGPVPVGDMLHLQSSTVVFRTQGDYAGALRLASLNVFDQTAWQADDFTPTSSYTPGSLVGATGTKAINVVDPNGNVYTAYQPLPPEPEWVSGPALNVHIEQLTGRALPTSAGPRAVEPGSGLDLTYDPTRDSIGATADLAPGDTYTVDTKVLDRSVLASAQGWTQDDSPVGDAMDLLPAWQMGHMDEIQALTTSVIGSATTQDAKLMAIQSYLTGSAFTYTLTPRWQATDDPVWDFLTYKQGYCVQFATAMAVMGRLAGIPMRVAVGYLPGRLGSDGWRTVTGAQAHMWPEAYFPDIGWVAYEPTPGVGQAVVSGATPTGTAPTSAAPSVEPTQTQTQALPTQPTASPTVGPSTPGSWQMTWPWLAGVGGGLAGAGGLALLVWLVYVLAYAPERAWRSMRRRAIQVGVVTEGMSVRTAVGAVSRRVDQPSVQGIARLRDALEVSRYAPPDVTRVKLRGPRLWRLTSRVGKQLRGQGPTGSRWDG